MLALIPARGGSKGLPGKNLRSLGGIPLIAHSIRQALDSALIARVVVSSDCPEILEISQAFGAETPFRRPDELSDDKASSLAVFRHAIENLEVEELVVLQPTSPLRSSNDIDNAVTLFRELQADSVVSCCLAHPLQWHFYQGDSGQLVPALPLSPSLQRQEARPALLPNGSIYCMKSAPLFERNAYLTDRSYPYLMPRSRSVDIDSLDDFLMAEAILKGAALWEHQGGGKARKERD